MALSFSRGLALGLANNWSIFRQSQRASSRLGGHTSPLRMAEILSPSLPSVLAGRKSEQNKSELIPLRSSPALHGQLATHSKGKNL